MKKSSILAITAAVSLAVSATANAATDNMEKCVPTDKDGKTLVKAHKGDCKAAKHSCAGQSTAADSDTWIYVPTGVCDSIKAGKWDKVPAKICEKIEGCITK